MSLKPKQESRPLNMDDIEQFRREVARFKQIRIGGKLRRPFDQWMVENGVASWDGERVAIVNPLEYTRWNNVRDRVEKYDSALQEQHWVAYPEEREAFYKKHIPGGYAAILGNMKVDNRVAR